MLTKLLRAGRARVVIPAARAPRPLQGFLDDRMTTHVAGWIRDSVRFHELYVVRNRLPRPSVYRVRLPAAS